MRQEPQSMVKPIVKASICGKTNCQVMLELVIAELRAGDYRSRMPDAAAKKRNENKYLELVGENICWDPEITNKVGYFRKLWDLLEQNFGEHDVEQDDRYSPHMLGQHLQQTQTSLASNDDTVFDQMQEDQSVEPITDVPTNQGTQPAIRNILNRRPPRRRSSFETQVESGFQQKLPIEQLGVFWVAANKPLKNEVDVREAFIKLESEEIKIRYLESLVGIDRYGNPCPHVDLLMTSQNLFQNVGMTGTSSMGIETDRTHFMGLLGMQSSELKESTKDTARVVHIHDDGNLRSRGIENLEKDELVELMLLEEDNLCKDVDFEEATTENNGVHMNQSENDSDDENEVRGNEEAVYMKIVRDQIATQFWSDKRLGSRRQ
ncbi:unnamed protein product [Eruca vesicaria subsp. sativa]|uniref:Uncharacterized protein n=1 Tax=Eruca vesicaria subsp. sativa TaxID=29727 RepID=A0ABC8JH91_ERUVS|nr:unnamed protein product [Eruca vesicaria subsp. sativa]